jgi:hypothetical protein
METFCTGLNIDTCAGRIHLIRFFLLNLHL